MASVFGKGGKRKHSKSLRLDLIFISNATTTLEKSMASATIDTVTYSKGRVENIFRSDDSVRRTEMA